MNIAKCLLRELEKLGIAKVNDQTLFDKMYL